MLRYFFTLGFILTSSLLFSQQSLPDSLLNRPITVEKFVYTSTNWIMGRPSKSVEETIKFKIGNDEFIKVEKKLGNIGFYLSQKPQSKDEFEIALNYAKKRSKMRVSSIISQVFFVTGVLFIVNGLANYDEQGEIMVIAGTPATVLGLTGSIIFSNIKYKNEDLMLEHLKKSVEQYNQSLKK